MAAAAAVQILLICREKTEFENFFPTTGGVTSVQNSISYKKFPTEILHKNSCISTY